jgi:ArsR family transcriptional regulator, arsenate/arsenite/antimonite-responsive transcriptional repressor
MSIYNLAMTKTLPSIGCCGRPLPEPLADDEAADIAQAFAALADPVRVRILSIVAGAGECCSCDLLEPLGKSQPTISHHTKVLADAGLLRGERRGKWVWWAVDQKRIKALREALR